MPEGRRPRQASGKSQGTLLKQNTREAKENGPRGVKTKQGELGGYGGAQTVSNITMTGLGSSSRGSTIYTTDEGADKRHLGSSTRRLKREIRNR